MRRPLRPGRSGDRATPSRGGSLAFPVLHQAYLLAGGRSLGVGAVAGVALSVGLVVGGAGLWLAGRANGNGQG